jgi:hypothetical protein
MEIVHTDSYSTSKSMAGHTFTCVKKTIWVSATSVLCLSQQKQRLQKARKYMLTTPTHAYTHIHTKHKNIVHPPTHKYIHTPTHTHTIQQRAKAMAIPSRSVARVEPRLDPSSSSCSVSSCCLFGRPCNSIAHW